MAAIASKATMPKGLYGYVVKYFEPFIASKATMPKGSYNEGITTTSASLYKALTVGSSRYPANMTRSDTLRRVASLKLPHGALSDY